MEEVTMQPVFINIPCPTKEEAVKLCSELIKQELCATAKIYEHVHLLYLKDSQVEGDDVVIMTLKTTDVNIPKIHRYMSEHHSWGNPCVEVIPIIADLC